jgi:hypothetical protein
MHMPGHIKIVTFVDNPKSRNARLQTKGLYCEVNWAALETEEREPPVLAGSCLTWGAAKGTDRNQGALDWDLVPYHTIPWILVGASARRAHGDARSEITANAAATSLCFIL